MVALSDVFKGRMFFNLVFMVCFYSSSLRLMFCEMGSYINEINKNAYFYYFVKEGNGYWERLDPS